MTPPRKRWFSFRMNLIIIGAVATSVLLLGASLQLNTSQYSVTTFDKSPMFAIPITGFGGYNWAGDVKQISATWRFPAIASDSPDGSASTWIGAQGGETSEFIQIGVVENRWSQRSTVYQAFWSDAAVNFSRQILFSANAGDLISRSMKKNNDAWNIQLVDHSKKVSVTKMITFRAGSSFIHAEWIQEDPTLGTIVARDVPYPDISNVRFLKLRVNESTPQLDLADELVLMASNGNIRVPTSVHSDSFTFDSPTGAALQYLRDAEALDVSSSTFNAAFVR